ncbi:MAG: TolC family protein [Candidatus Eremiobacteraeota bacterium]|nr:TolC family protein [Candidatus Eremiobacteraeota bacterium]MBV8366403.1 TolC family protein [Candidatus Eremiobacteraeota bacterium]
MKINVVVRSLSALAASAGACLAILAAHAPVAAQPVAPTPTPVPLPASQPSSPPLPAPAPTVFVPTGPAVSLSVQQAITMALTNNLAYQSAAQDVLFAQGQLISARGNAYPVVSAGYSYEHYQNEGFVFFPVPQPVGPPILQKEIFSAANINNVNATLQYAIYTGGAVQAAIGAAAANYSAAQSNYAAARADVINNTTSAYYSLLLAQRTAVISDEAVDVANQNLKTSQELFTAGTAARADVLRQQVALANAQVDAVRAHNSAYLANANLANLLNINLNSVITPQFAPTAPPVYSLADLLQEAQVRRPEIASAIDAVTIAEKTVTEARSGTLPQISLGITDASSKPNFFNVPQPQLSETLAVYWKLFDGGFTHGKVVQAQADVDKAKINLQQLRNSVDLQVRQAYFNYVAAQSAAVAALSGQTSAAESLRVTQLRYRAGVGTALDLTDALLTFTQTQVTYATALADESTALIELQRAAGLL